MHLLNDFEVFKIAISLFTDKSLSFLKMKKRGNTLFMLLQIIDGVMYAWYYNNIIIDKSESSNDCES